MKRILIAATLAALALAGMPAQARTLYNKSYTFRASQPCATVCAYQLDQRPNEEFLKDWSGEEVDVPNEEVQDFQACSAPFPQGSYADLVLKAPRYSKVLIFKGYPVGDWDIFVCSKPRGSNNGKQFAYSANYVDECQTGCVETITMRVTAGRWYVLRAYNFADTEPMPARIWFKS